MNDYPYATLGADRWLRCDGLHRPGFPTFLWDVLHRFGYTGTPVYCGRLYREFRRGCCEVHVDVPTHPSDPSMIAWFIMAIGDDLDDTLERATHQALMKFCERHLPGLDDTVVALFPIWNEGNTAWSERLTTVGDPEHPTYHVGWEFTARYAQHVSSMPHVVTVTGTYQRLCLEEYNHQVEAKTCLINDIQKGNR
jgi:hypothetical protein